MQPSTCGVHGLDALHEGLHDVLPRFIITIALLAAPLHSFIL
jgi:hypothetical protein